MTTILLRPYTLKELSGLYGVSKTVMRNWIFPLQTRLGERVGHYYSVLQVKLIIEHLGWPEEKEIDAFNLHIADPASQGG